MWVIVQYSLYSTELSQEIYLIYIIDIYILHNPKRDVIQ